MTIKEMQEIAEAIQSHYAKKNQQDGHHEWTGKDYVMGFAGDFGDLMKLVMAKEGMRTIEGHDEKLEHELADCLWSILVLAKNYDIDLEKAFTKTMHELDQRLSEDGV